MQLAHIKTINNQFLMQDYTFCSTFDVILIQGSKQYIYVALVSQLLWQIFEIIVIFCICQSTQQRVKSAVTLTRASYTKRTPFLVRWWCRFSASSELCILVNWFGRMAQWRCTANNGHMWWTHAIQRASHCKYIAKQPLYMYAVCTIIPNAVCHYVDFSLMCILSTRVMEDCKIAMF